MLSNLPSRWDMEADVVAIGSGIGGLSAAITAHDLGHSAIVLERSGQVGGVTALSMGEVWVAGNHHAAELGLEDSVDSGYRYVRRLAMEYGNPLAILNTVVHAREALKYFEDRVGLEMEVIRDCPDYYFGASNDAVSEGRMLECAPFKGATLGEWQHRTRVSPQMPYGFTHADMAAGGGTANMMQWDFARMGERLTNDERCLGTGLAAYFVKGALDRDIPLLTDANAEELIADGERVVGVRATHEGQEIFIKANLGVVVAVSSYEQNQELNATLARQLEQGSMLFSGINGANFRLAGPLGARVGTVPDITSLGVTVPGEEDEEGKPLWRSALPVIGQPHTIVVNRQGKRFGDEAFYRSFYYKIDEIDGGTQTHPNFPCWVVIDSQVLEKYPFFSVTPGQDFPEGFGVRADTLAALAQAIGVDAEALQQTVARFNAGAERGEDPEFGRGSRPWSAWMCGDVYHKPNPNLGPLEKGPFYAVELHRMGGTGIASAGLMVDEHARVISWMGQPIPGLYAAGNSTARMETGAVMQSGISNARGMTQGWLAAKEACGSPSDLLARAAQRMGI